MLGCTVLSLVNVCLFPQSARSAGLRVIPTAWHFRLWVCLPLLIPASIIPSSSPSICMSWQTLMWTNSNQLTKGLCKHSSIGCSVVLFCLWVCKWHWIELKQILPAISCTLQRTHLSAITREHRGNYCGRKKSTCSFKWGRCKWNLPTQGNCQYQGVCLCLPPSSRSFTHTHTLSLSNLYLFEENHM